MTFGSKNKANACGGRRRYIEGWAGRAGCQIPACILLNAVTATEKKHQLSSGSTGGGGALDVAVLAQP